MNSSSRLIRAGHAAATALPWHAPDVDVAPAGAVPADTGTGADAPDAAERAWQAGFEAGRAAGHEAGAGEIRELAAALERVLDACARPLQDLEHQAEAEVLALVQELVRQLVRREVALDPAHVVGVIRAGLAELPLAAGNVVVRLHPADAAVVRDVLPADGGDRAWRLEADPLQERGGCMITSSNSVVDGRLDTRLARVIGGLLEDTRGDAG
jgi:flagellar assembly protein FliH